MKHYVIIGAGISGLSLGHYLSKNGQKVTIIEKNNKVGGISSSFSHKDFILDIGPHKLYSQMQGIMPFFKTILKQDNLIVKKKNSLFFLGKYFSFPLSISNLISNISPKTVWNGFKIGFSALPSFLPSSKKPANYEEYFKRGFGKSGYKLLFEGYAKKVWGNPKDISVELARKRIPVESIPKAVMQMLSKKEKSKISADFFYYPKHGIVQVCENLAEEIKQNKGRVLLNEEVKGIVVKGNKAVKVKTQKKEIEGDYIISTSHINALAEFVKPNISKESYEASKKLKYSSLVLVYLFLNKKKALDENWVFFLGDEVIFNRVSEQKSFSPYTVPENKTVICAEVTIPPGSTRENLSDNEILNIVKKDLRKVGIIKNESEIYESIVRKEDEIYPVYNIDYKANLNLVLKEINSIKNLLTIGRYGLFNYNNMDHCIDMGYIVGKFLLEGKEKSNWPELEKRFENYKIVD
jgi:protoporphyrinogen oxidase